MGLLEGRHTCDALGNTRFDYSTHKPVELAGFPIADRALDTLCQMRKAVEAFVAAVKQSRALFRTQMFVSPCRLGAIKSIEVFFEDPAIGHEVVVLFGSGNRCEDVERCDVRSQFNQGFQMLTNPGFSVFRKANDV